jgi:hypothetical protein
MKNARKAPMITSKHLTWGIVAGISLLALFAKLVEDLVPFFSNLMGMIRDPY